MPSIGTVYDRLMNKSGRQDAARAQAFGTGKGMRCQTRTSSKMGELRSLGAVIFGVAFVRSPAEHLPYEGFFTAVCGDAWIRYLRGVRGASGQCGGA